MKQRVISGTVIAAVIVCFGLVGGYPLAVLIMICSMIGYLELCRAAGVLDSSEKTNLLTGLALGVTVIYYTGLMVMQFRWGSQPDKLVSASDLLTVTAIIAAFISQMAAYVFTFPKYKSEQVMAGFFSFVYSPILLSYTYRARTLPYGIYLYALIFVCSSVCDTCALAAGVKFGKRSAFRRAVPDHRDLRSAGGHGRRPCCLCDQEEPRRQRLREPDTRTRRDHGPCRQHTFYGTTDLHIGRVLSGSRRVVKRKGRALCSPLIA